MVKTHRGTGDPAIVTYADIVDNGGQFTTTGVADRIVKTGADGSIDIAEVKVR